MKSGIVKVAVTAAVAVCATVLVAIAGTNAEGTPDMSGRYEGKMKIKFAQQFTGGEKGKEKPSIVLDVFQDGGEITAFMGFNGEPVPVCFKALVDEVNQTIGLNGVVGNGTFTLQTPSTSEKILIVGTAKANNKGVKLKTSGLFAIDRGNPEAGSIKFNAKRTGDVPDLIVAK